MYTTRIIAPIYNALHTSSYILHEFFNINLFCFSCQTVLEIFQSILTSFEEGCTCFALSLKTLYIQVLSITSPHFNLVIFNGLLSLYILYSPLSTIHSSGIISFKLSFKAKSLSGDAGILNTLPDFVDVKESLRPGGKLY